MNVARIGLLLAGFLNMVSGMVDRFCSSGVQAAARRRPVRRGRRHDGLGPRA